MSLSKVRTTLCLLLPCLVMSDRRPYKQCPSSFRRNDILINCATDYLGYCAFYHDGPYTRQKLTANECTACTDRSVKGYQTHECTADRVYCDPRVRPEVCTEQYISICAYTSENCNDDSCRKVGENPCIACSDPNVIFYEKGECPQPTVNTCDSENRPTECVTDEYNPVCGLFTEGCPYGTCVTTYTAPCYACLDPKVETYTQGECDPSEEVRNCELIDIPEVCPEVYEPVCGASRDCVGDDCAHTYNNACLACSNRVRLFKEGECPQPASNDPSEEVRNCDLIDMPPVCSQVYEPVCGTSRDCTGDNCDSTYGNACLACTSGVGLFKEGECPQ